MANGRDRRRQTQDQGPSDDVFEEVVRINRCAKVMKGGRRFSFSALVVVGDRDGNVGVGFGKANDVPTSVEKGVKEARRSMLPVARDGTTIPHEVKGRFGAARVLILPAPPGTGVIAGASVRAVLMGAGIQDVLTKSIGSSNPMNLVKATHSALRSLRTKEQVAELRGVGL
jgi:small subunit ribosomal protein S5